MIAPKKIPTVQTSDLIRLSDKVECIGNSVANLALDMRPSFRTADNERYARSAIDRLTRYRDEIDGLIGELKQALGEQS